VKFQKKEENKMSENPRVLLIDDEASLRRQLLVGLAQRGFEVEECEDGLSALKKIESARRNGIPHHYVITDIRLPDIDGLKLLQVIKSKYPDLPVVVISGYGDETTGEDVKDKLGNAYLDKPFDLETLETELNRIGLPEKEAEKAKKTGLEAERPVSAYVFIRGKSDADLYEMYSKLYFADGVLYCDAVRGDWDIVLLLQAPDKKGIEKLAKDQVESLSGVDEIKIHYSERPKLGEDMESFIHSFEKMGAMESAGEEPMDKRNRGIVSAYAVVEIDRSRLSQLYSKLYFTENVVYCDASDDGNLMILLLQGQDFDQIRRTISNEVRAEAGVLRVKVMNIIEMMTM
jgi:CheY-like chemotaxis protein